MRQKKCAHCATLIPISRVTCGREVCVTKQTRLMNARNHKERWDARIAAGLCGRCGARKYTPGYVTCPSCRAVVRARRAAQRAQAQVEAETQERLLALAARRARSADRRPGPAVEL